MQSSLRSGRSDSELLVPSIAELSSDSCSLTGNFKDGMDAIVQLLELANRAEYDVCGDP